MRTLCLILSLLLSQAIIAQTTISVADLERPSRLVKKQKHSYKLVDMTHARMFFKIDPTKRYIAGEVRLSMKALEKNQTELSLDLHSDITVDAVWWNGVQLQQNKISHKNDLITLQLNQAISTNTTDSIRIQYKGTPPIGAFQGFSQDEHESGQIVWTLSEPYASKEWWPAQHTLLDKIDSIDVLILSPEGNHAASNGILVREEKNNGWKLDHWKHRHPIATYLVAIAVSNYERYSDYLETDDQKIEILNYVYPHSLESAKRNTPETVKIMKLFNELFVTYPFADEKYGHAQFSWGGGMEHQTMSFMYGFYFSLVAHELAHQWFGNYITCGSWKEIWINEGYATYLEGLCYENGLGNQKFHEWLSSNNRDITGKPGGSLYVDDTTSVRRVFNGRLSYNKGAMVIHMLRKQIGDEAFFNATKAILNDKKLQHSFATTAELQKHYEESSGKDLSAFFEDWIYNEGYPKFKLRWAQDTNNKTVFELTQQSSVDNGNVFEMKIPITVSSEGKKQKIWLPQEKTTQMFVEQVDFKIEQVDLNADIDIITLHPTIIRDQKLLLTQSEYQPSIIQIVPNPAQERIEVFWNQELQPDTVQLFDTNGKKLLSKGAGKSRTSVQFPLINLPSGMYIIKVIVGSDIYEQKFVKQ